MPAVCHIYEMGVGAGGEPRGKAKCSIMRWGFGKAALGHSSQRDGRLYQSAQLSIPGTVSIHLNREWGLLGTNLGL